MFVNGTLLGMFLCLFLSFISPTRSSVRRMISINIQFIWPIVNLIIIIIIIFRYSNAECVPCLIFCLNQPSISWVPNSARLWLNQSCSMVSKASSTLLTCNHFYLNVVHVSFTNLFCNQINTIKYYLPNKVKVVVAFRYTWFFIIIVNSQINQQEKGETIVDVPIVSWSKKTPFIDIIV